MGFTQFSCLAQPELLKNMYILSALVMKMESQPESFPVHFLIEGTRLLTFHKSMYHVPMSTLL